MCASNPKIGSLYTKCCCEAQLNVPNFLTSSKIVSASVDPQTVIILLQHSHCQISQSEPSQAPVDHPQLQVHCSQADSEPRAFQA